MASRDQIIKKLDQLLLVDRFKDYSPIGLQVEGCAEVSRVVTGVSVNMALLEQAKKADAQMVLVHHGMFWKDESAVLAGAKKKRVKFLLDHDLSLVGYHLPLDAHAELGNNTQLVLSCGARRESDFGDYQGNAIGAVGVFDEPVSARELVERMRKHRAEPMVFCDPDKPIRRFGAVSGGAGAMFPQAIDARLDLYLTGEPWEPARALAEETGVGFIALGHHNSERLGVQALGRWLAQQLETDVQFVDIENPA